MNRTARWLLLVLLMISVMPLMDGAAYAQTGTTVSVVCNQYLRAEPIDAAARVGLMNPGETHAVLGRSGGWLYIEISPTLQGWAYYGNCLYLNGELDSLPVLDPAQIALQASAAPPAATVVCNQYLRRYPSSDGIVIRILGVGEALSVGGRTTAGDWMLVTTRDGQVGWTGFTNCISVTGNFLAAPIADPGVTYSGPPAIDVTCEQYVRVRPSTEAARIAIMYPADDLWSVNGRDARGSWFFVTNADGGFTGWTANSNCTTLLGDFRAIPIVPEDTFTTITGEPVAMLACSQYLRAFPANEGRRLAVMDPSWGVLNLLGRTADFGWVYVNTADGQEGWTATGNCLVAQGNLASLPVLESAGLLTSAGDPTVRIVCSQYLRSRPEAEATRLAIMNPGELYEIAGRSRDGNWLYLRNDSFEGWAAWGNCLETRGNVQAAPVVDLTYTGEPIASVTCTQYLRAAPSMGAQTLDPMPAGTALQILGRSQDGSWVYVQKSDGSQGWTALGSCLNVLGNVYSRPVLVPGGYDGPPRAVVNCSQFLRATPNDNGEKLMVINGVEGPLWITGRNANSTWMQITLEDGRVGWAATGICLGVEGNFYTVPEVAVVQAVHSGPPLATVTCSQNLRSLPDEASPKLAILNGTEGLLTITGRSADGNWMQITLENGTTGWAATGVCLGVEGDLNAAPVVEITSPLYSGPPIASLACTQYLREQPTSEGARLSILRPEDGLLTILGRNENTSWLYIQAADGTEGWTANGTCLVVQGRLNVLPVRQITGYNGPAVADIVCDTNLRRTPTRDGAILTVLPADTGLFNVLARNEGSEWLLLEGSNGLAGWVSLGSCVQTQGNVASVPVPNTLVSDPSYWTVLQAVGACNGSDQASQVIASYNRTAPIGPVSRRCTSSEDGLRALTQFQADIAIVEGACPGFQQVTLSGGQTLCHRFLRTTQVDDFMNYARGR